MPALFCSVGCAVAQVTFMLSSFCPSPLDVFLGHKLLFWISVVQCHQFQGPVCHWLPSQSISSTVSSFV